MLEAAPYTIDLHVHTINSDGRDTTEDVLRKASSRGIRTLVFSEHSRADNYAEAKQLAPHYNIEIPFPAVEISTIYQGNKHHILAYGSAVLDPMFQAYAAYPTEYKNMRHAAIVTALQAQGIAIPSARDIMRGLQPDGTYSYPLKWMLGRTAIAQAVAQTLHISLEEARALFMDGYAPEARKVQLPADRDPSFRYVDTVQTIKTIRQIGALPVLAHPWWELQSGRTNVERMLAQVERFCQVGLQGVEVLSYHYAADQIPAGINLAERFGILTFGGSDYHGNGKTEPGIVGLTPEQFEPIRARVLARHPISIDTAPRFGTVVFDAGFTLIHDIQNPTMLVKKLLSRTGHPLLTDEQLEQAEAAARATLPAPALMWRDDASARQALRTYYQTFLHILDYHAPQEAQQIDELINTYTSPDNWQPYPEVEATLALLKLHHVQIGVVANWQSTLPTLLSALNLSHYIDFVLPSASIGVAKPESAIFQEAVRLSGHTAQDMLFIGDDPQLDIAGAQAAGIAAIHLDRQGSTNNDLRLLATRILHHKEDL